MSECKAYALQFLLSSFTISSPNNTQVHTRTHTDCERERHETDRQTDRDFLIIPWKISFQKAEEKEKERQL